MGCFKKCRRWTVLSFNLLFFGIGITLIILGALANNNLNELSKLVPSSYNYITATPITFIVLGSISALVAILGSFGALKWNLFLLTTYTITLLIIFLLHIVLSLVTFLAVTNQNNLSQAINTTLEEVYHEYAKNSEVVDFLQDELECCGTFGPKYWNGTFPKSCGSGLVYQTGCQMAFYDFLLDTIRYIGVTVLALAPLQVIGATLSLSLVNSIRNYERRYGKYMR